MTNQNTSTNPQLEEDEIDLIALAKTLWNGRKTVIKTILIFLLIGLITAIFSPKQYTASTTMVPATQGKSLGGNLGGLAAIAGINLGSMGSDASISPTLYPQIINSIPFQKELLQTSLTIEGQSKKVTYSHYYTDIYSPGLLGVLKKYTIGLPGLLIKAIKGKPKSVTNPSSLIPEIQSISNEENELIKQLTNQLSLDVNVKDGYITVAATMPEAIAAAELTKKAQELLQQYIISFKIQKSTEQLKYIQDRYQEKERAFKTIQNQLARSKDRNQNVTTAIAQANVQNLQSQYDLAYSVYSELAKQLETQQLQVKEDTPVFTILKPVSVPMEKSKPNRPLIVIIWTFLGGIVGVGMVFGRTFVLDMKEKWNE